MEKTSLTDDSLKPMECSKIPELFKCAVVQCKNKFVNFETHQTSPLKFHNFPTNSEFSARWKKLCLLAPTTDTANLRVCSEHFQLDDYPEEKSLIKNHTLSLENTESSSINIEANINIHEEEPVVANIKKGRNVREKDETSQLLATKLKNQIKELRQKNKSIVYNIRRKQKRIETIKKEIKRSIGEVDNSKEYSILRSIFSDAQISLLKGDQEKIYWTDDDLAQAFTLRHMGGKDLYLYLKNTLNYPLPSLRSIQAWAANI